MIHQFSKIKVLHGTACEVLIILLEKQEKDFIYCSHYHSWSLIRFDCKIFADVFVTWLKSVMQNVYTKIKEDSTEKASLREKPTEFIISNTLFCE